MDAVFWDFDGTLANSAATNVEITKAILADHVPRLSGENLPLALRSLEEYQVANHQAKNWRDLYRHFYGMTEDELAITGPQWQTYQRKMAGMVKPFPGIEQAVDSLSGLSQAICSQNDKQNILSWLCRHNMQSLFHSIKGYGCVASDQQKPHPSAFVAALNEVKGCATVKRLAYIGDHEADTEFSRKSEALLNEQGANVSVVSVAVSWSGANPKEWNLKPDYIADHPEALAGLLLG